MIVLVGLKSSRMKKGAVFGILCAISCLFSRLSRFASCCEIRILEAHADGCNFSS